MKLFSTYECDIGGDVGTLLVYRKGALTHKYLMEFFSKGHYHLVSNILHRNEYGKYKTHRDPAFDNAVITRTLHPHQLEVGNFACVVRNARVTDDLANKNIQHEWKEIRSVRKLN